MTPQTTPRTDSLARYARKWMMWTCILSFSLTMGIFAFPSATQADHTTYMVRGDEDYPPYEFINELGEPDGFNIDLIKSVSKVMGFTPLISLGPWTEVKNDLFQRRIDILTGMYFSSKRDRDVDFSTPFIIVTHSIFVQKGSPIRSVADLEGKRVLVQNGDIMHEWAEKNLSSSKILPVDNQGTALRRLSMGEGDCALLGTLQGLYNAERFSLTNITSVGPSILPQRYCFAVPAGRQELLARLNEGLSILKRTGEFDRIYEKWFGVYTEKTFPTAIFLWVLLLLFVVGGASVVWNWSLHRRVYVKTRELNQELAQRIRAENALKQKEEDLRGSLAEKEVLLKEIHHRVKNNLQIISSLLALQMDQLDTPTAKDMFIDCQRRITSMALVHEELYQSKSLSRVNLADYVKKLVKSYSCGLRTNNHVAFEVQVQSFNLPVHKAIPFGLILNELVTNSIKHAFVEKNGIITIVAHSTEHVVSLAVSDTGSGFPENFSPDHATGLGMQLVLGLTKQLDGKIHMDNAPGARVRIVFPE